MIDPKDRWALDLLIRGAAAEGWVRVAGAATDCYIRPGLDGGATARVVLTGIGWIGESFLFPTRLVLHLPDAVGWWDAVWTLQNAERHTKGWVPSTSPMHFCAALDAPGWFDLPPAMQDIVPRRRLGRVLEEVDLVVLELDSAPNGCCWMPTVNSRPVTTKTGLPLVFFSLSGATEAAELAAEQEAG